MQVNWKTIEVLFEQQGLIGDHCSNRTNIRNLSYDEIGKCCSLSNNNPYSRFFYRICAFFKNWKWMNDTQIGISLFYEALWINSAVFNSIQKQDYSHLSFYISQIQLIDKIFDRIVLSTYQPATNVKFPHLPAPIPVENLANPEISKMFPIQMVSAVGVTVAIALSKQIKVLEKICKEDDPYKYLLKQFCLHSKVLNAHRVKLNDTVEGTCWSQTVTNPISPFPIIHNAKCFSTYGADLDDSREHTVDSNEDQWWNAKAETEKIESLCSQEMTITKVNKLYLSSKTKIPPFKIQHELYY